MRCAGNVVHAQSDAAVVVCQPYVAGVEQVTDFSCTLIL